MTAAIVDLRTIALERLNALPPHSRYRAGYCDLLRHVTKLELQEERLHKECVDELERAFGSDLERLREVW